VLGNLVSADSRATDNGMPFRFNDPTAGGQDDAHFEQQGKTWNSVAIATSVIGGVVGVAGVAMLVVDQVVLKKRNGLQEKPKKSSSEDAWFLTPSASPTSAGVSAGFAFY
jgi:hypothetical protein